MVELLHSTPEPRKLIDYRNESSSGSWDNRSFDPIREILRRQLNQEQAGICVYCEGRVEANEGHLDHIKPRSRFHSLTFDYSNLAQSCNSQYHCGHRKADSVMQVEPRRGCNRFFSLRALDGTITAAPNLDPSELENARDTIKVLNLNAVSLARNRWKYVQVLIYLPEADRAEFRATAPFRWILGSL